MAERPRGHVVRQEELPRLRNNLARVFNVLVDGREHTADELAAVGGSAWDSRVRDLRAEHCGSQVVHVGYRGEALRTYQLDLNHLTPEWRARLLVGDSDKRTTPALARCPRCNGSGKIPRGGKDKLLADLMALVDAAGNAGIAIPQGVLDLEKWLAE